jgi:hypothetical protein
MSLRVNKDNIFFVLPESRYSVSRRIDKYMDEDFSLFIKFKVYPDCVLKDIQTFAIARNGMHSGISTYKDELDNISICFTYWLTKEVNGKKEVYPKHIFTGLL